MLGTSNVSIASIDFENIKELSSPVRAITTDFIRLHLSRACN